MNQILVTQKLYVTPELRRKKKIYKIQFFLSVFLVCLLFSYYIYAEYDRSKSEEVSQEILTGIKEENNEEDTTIKKTDNIIVVALDDDEEDEGQNVEQTPTAAENKPSKTKYTSTSGQQYTVEAIVRVPRLGINYPVIAETSEELLKISVNKYWGPEPNTVGNYCIVGHNYKSKKMFGRLSEAVNGDIVELEDTKGNVVKYEVYDRYVVNPTDTQCTSQLTGGKKEVTLITCTNYGQQRLVVKAREVK